MEKQSLPQTENLQFQFSFFRNTWSKESTIITLYNLYLQTIGTLWKAQTECYRKLQDRPDRSNEAKMVKDAMPVVIIEGICRPHCSHAAANLEKMSRLAMYDLDHLNERTSAVKALFRALPYVAYTQTSISDRGLKVVVFLDARTPEEYPLAYAICQQTLERIAGHPCDRTMRPHHPALFLRMGCRRLLQSHSRTLSVEGRTRHRPFVNQPDQG